MIAIKIDDNAEAVLRQVREFPARMARDIAAALDYQNELTVGYIQTHKLSHRGPKTLGVRTNRLRSSIRPTKATVHGNQVDSAIGSNVVYAGVHEFGIDKQVQVRAHTRKVPVGPSLALGKRITARDVARASGKSGGARTIQVRAHAMHMKFPARRYIESSIEERIPAYTHAISSAIVTAWRAEK